MPAQDSTEKELHGPLQRFEIVSPQQPHDQTFTIPLGDGRQFQVTVAVIDQVQGNYRVRKPFLNELAAGIARLASLPIVR